MAIWEDALLKLLQTAVWAFAVYMLGRFLVTQLEGHLGKAAERIRKVGPLEFDAVQTPPQSSEPGNPIIAEQASSNRSQAAESNLTRVQSTQLQSVRAWIESLEPGERQVQVEIALANWQVSWNFEVLNFQMLGSQLAFLGQCNTTSVTEASARATYDATSKWYPHIYANYSFDLWINWLVNAGLIVQGDAFAITDLGREFLRYIVGRGYNLVRAS